MPDQASSQRRPSTELRRALALGAVVAGCLPLLGLCACVREIQGDGVFRQEARTAPAFAGVAVDSAIITSVVVGPAQGIVASGDENVLAQLETTVREDPARGIPVLELRVPDQFVPVHPLRVDLTVPWLAYLHASGAAAVTVTGARAAALEVEASDGSAVSLAGDGGGALDAHVSGGPQGGARLDAGAYPVATAAVALTGGAQASVEASAAVTGTAAPGCVVENVGPGVCQVTDGAGSPVSCAPP